MIKYTKQLMLFKELSHKKIQVDFQGGQITSDTGILFLRETEKRIGLIEKILLPCRNGDTQVMSDMILDTF